jgi:uncharacterized protein
MKSYWDFILIFVALGALIPWRGTVRIRRLLVRPQISSGERLIIYASTIAFQWFLVGVAAWRAYAHRITPDNLGVVVRHAPLTAAATAILAVGLGILQTLGIRSTAASTEPGHSRIREISLRLMPGSLVESLVFSALALTASMCEEFLYRGFVFAALALVTHSIAIAVIGSSLLFSLAHLYQGPRGVVATFVLGAVFAISRVVTGNLLPAFAGHLVVDLMAGYIAPKYLRKRVAAGAGPTASRQDTVDLAPKL